MTGFSQNVPFRVTDAGAGAGQIVALPCGEARRRCATRSVIPRARGARKRRRCKITEFRPGGQQTLIGAKAMRWTDQRVRCNFNAAGGCGTVAPERAGAVCRAPGPPLRPHVAVRARYHLREQRGGERSGCPPLHLAALALRWLRSAPACRKCGLDISDLDHDEPVAWQCPEYASADFCRLLM